MFASGRRLGWQFPTNGHGTDGHGHMCVHAALLTIFFVRFVFLGQPSLHVRQLFTEGRQNVPQQNL